MKTFISGWYVIYTKPKFERKVVEKLSMENVGFYFPTSRSVRKWSDRKKVIETPLFPSYIFVYLQHLQDYYTGLSADGALQYVRFGKEIARVDDNIVQNLKTLVDNGGDLELSVETFKLGQTMLIKDGPLSGLSCEVVRHKDRDKILVRLSLLNRCVLVDMAVDHLMSV